MIKRTFVLFFCLIQTLAFSLLSEQSGSLYKTNSNLESITSDAESLCSHEEEDCEEIDVTPIIRADELEWRENLSDLLRHRHSSYRFITFESVVSVYLQFTTCHKILQKSKQSFLLQKGLLTLPAYYSFLYRLCPF